MRPKKYLPSFMLANLLAGAMQMGVSASTFADTLDDDEVTMLGSVTVTARRVEEDIKNVPGSVHVESTHDLEQERMLDGSSALRDVAGASLGVFGDRSNAFVVMRGIGPILTSLSPDDSSVLTFVDGAPLSIGASFSSYLDLERMEVMKGPQNTLFGRNTSGGAINLVPAKPSHDFEASLRSEVGNEGTLRGETILNGSLVPELLAGRIALRRSRTDSYIHNIAGKDLGGESTWAGRASLLLTPTPEASWLVSVQGEATDSVPTPYIAYRPGGARTAAQTRMGDDIRMLALSSRFDYDFNAMTFTVQTSYSRFRAWSEYNLSDAILANDYSGLPIADFLGPLTNFSASRKRDTRLTQEFRLSSLQGADIAWLTGIVWYQDHARRDGAREMWYFGPSVSGLHDYDLKTTGQALFAETTVPLGSRFKLTLGARGTHESKKFWSDYRSTGAPGTVPYFFESGKRNYNFLTGRTALSWDWTQNAMSYVSVSRGYKSGGFGTSNALMSSGVAREPYGSSSVMSYETGARSNWLDNTLAVNGAIFFNDVSKEQILTNDYSTFTSKALNIDTRSSGFELDVEYRPSKHWWMRTGVAYTRSEMRHVTAEIAALQNGLRNGNKLPTVPEWGGNVAIGYQGRGTDWGMQGWLAEQRINASVSYNYTGNRYTDASNFGRLAPVHLLSARLGMEWNNGEVYLFGNNLLNKKYMTIKEKFGTDPSTGNTVFGVSYARGAVVGIGAELHF